MAMLSERMIGSFRKKYSELDIPADDMVVRVNTHGGTPLRVMADQLIVTRSADNQRRRTIVLEKGKDNSWGFTLESYSVGAYGPHNKNAYSFVDYIELDGPAFRGGMRKGDVIIAINGSATLGCSHEELVVKIQRCRRTMRLIVLHEDTCNKVERQLKLFKLKHILSEKERELQMLVQAEEELLNKVKLRSQKASPIVNGNPAAPLSPTPSGNPAAPLSPTPSAPLSEVDGSIQKPPVSPSPSCRSNSSTSSLKSCKLARRLYVPKTCIVSPRLSPRSSPEVKRSDSFLSDDFNLNDVSSIGSSGISPPILSPPRSQSTPNEKGRAGSGLSMLDANDNVTDAISNSDTNSLLNEDDAITVL